jgi:type II secretory pathway pseudopilin PulG
MKLLGRAAQMHVLEVLLVATLFTSAVNVAVISLPASDATRVGDDNLRHQGMQLLQVLDEWQTGAGESTLATWLSEDNSSALLSYLDGGLPAAASYRLTGAHGGSSETLVERGTPEGTVSIAFRLVWVGSELWELELSLWYGPRGTA